MFKVSDVLSTARYVINDTDTVTPRNSDAELIGYLNDGIREISILAPSLFSVIIDFSCTAGTCLQSLSFTSYQRVLDVIGIKNGTNIRECSLDAMSDYNPSWQTDAAGAAVNWLRVNSDNPLQFYIYPKAPTSQTIEVRCLKIPTILTALTDNVSELPDGLKPALEDYVIFRAESKDDEYADDGRAGAHYQKFLSAFGAGQPQQPGA